MANLKSKFTDLQSKNSNHQKHSFPDIQEIINNCDEMLRVASTARQRAKQLQEQLNVFTADYSFRKHNSSEIEPPLCSMLPLCAMPPPASTITIDSLSTSNTSLSSPAAGSIQIIKTARSSKIKVENSNRKTINKLPLRKVDKNQITAFGATKDNNQVLRKLPTIPRVVATTAINSLNMDKSKNISTAKLKSSLPPKGTTIITNITGKRVTSSAIGPKQIIVQKAPKSSRV